MIGNVPFARSTDVIRKLVEAANPPRDAWLVVQRELAHRLCGRPLRRNRCGRFVLSVLAPGDRGPAETNRVRSAAFRGFGFPAAQSSGPTPCSRPGGPRLLEHARSRFSRPLDGGRSAELDAEQAGRSAGWQLTSGFDRTMHPPASASNSGWGFSGLSPGRQVVPLLAVADGLCQCLQWIRRGAGFLGDELGFGILNEGGERLLESGIVDERVRLTGLTHRELIP